MYKRYRFPAEIIQYAVWLYFRFNLSHRDIEDLLAQRGIIVSRESIRLWCNKFGSKYAARLRIWWTSKNRVLIFSTLARAHEANQWEIWRSA